MFKRSDTDLFESLTFWALLAILAGYLVWLLSMPAWPSQDGPVHLYYTRVLDALLSKDASPFRAHFFIKHLLPPYALYYYALLLFSHFVSLLTADRLVVCGYVASFLLGFRYAARAIGPNAGVTSLLASVLVLNWALGMGFTNYCLSFSFALWALGLWLRLGGEREIVKRLAFFVLLVLITLTHPIPLLLVLAFGGVDLLCRFVADRRGLRPISRQHLTAGALTLASGLLCVLYVKAFTVAHPLAQRTPVFGSLSQQILRRIKDILIMKNVEVLYGHWWQVETYRICLGLILVAATFLAVQQWRQHRRVRVWTNSDTATIFAACVAVVLPLLPSDLSGAYYFFERLNELLWVVMLLAASGWAPTMQVSGAQGGAIVARNLPAQAKVNRFAVVFSLVLTAIILHIANATLRPFANRDYRMAHVDLPMRGQFAMVLDGGQERKYRWSGPPWDPYYWDTVALLRRNEAIMVNAPWLDSPIIPLAETETEPGATLTPLLANSPVVLGDQLKESAALRSRLLDKTDFAFFSPVRYGSSKTGVPSLLGTGWACHIPTGGEYRVCMRSQDTEMARVTP